MEKLSPLLRRNHRLMMIREGLLRLNPDGNGEDRYLKLGSDDPLAHYHLRFDSPGQSNCVDPGPRMGATYRDL